MKTIEFYISKNLKIYSIYQLIKSSKEKSTFFKNVNIWGWRFLNIFWKALGFWRFIYL